MDEDVLSRYISNPNGNIFVLTNLPEVVKGTLFSRYSRSDKSLKELLLTEFLSNKDLGILDGNVNKEKAEEFYERVLIGYGDDSVAELAFIHVGIENVSNIATKALEDARIGISPLEKSTRYVYFDKKEGGKYKYYREPRIMEKFGEEYEEVMDFLFDTYSNLIKPLNDYLKEKFPREEGVSERAYNSAIKAKTCDVLRGLLPASTLTNLGLAGNGRAFEYLIIKLRASPLKELNEIAEKMHDEIRKVLPKFVKRAFSKHGDMWVEFFKKERELFTKFSSLNSTGNGEFVKLVKVKGSEDDVIAGIIYAFSSLSYEEALSIAEKMSKDEKVDLIRTYFSFRKNRRHKPHRAFELISYTFDIIANFGAYRDLQRHRILTQMRQNLTVDLGYDMPEEISEIGEEKTWKEAMERSAELYYKIRKELPYEAQYVVPFAYRVRFLFHLNLREAFHLCELRSSEQGHPDYRRIAIKIADEIKKVHPIIGDMKFVNRKKVSLERINAEVRIDKKIEELKKKYGSSLN